MENILLVLNIVFAVILVLLVLMQKSEGGALGIGVSQESYMFSKSAGNFMTKATAVVATLFIICSLALTIVSRDELIPTTSVLDSVEEKSEGGALGIGVSQDNFMFSRTAGDFLTKATGIVATLFIICSLSLTIVSRGDLISETSVIDAVEETEDTPKIPDNNN